MTTYIIPAEDTIVPLLTPLFGEDTEVASGDAVDSASGYVANYVSEENLVAVCIADASLVANAGASMMMIPADVAKDAVKDNDLTPVMIDSFYEVANILSRALMNAHSAHLRLSTLSRPGEGTDSVSQLGDDCTEISFSVDIPGYGKGSMSFKIS